MINFVKKIRCAYVVRMYEIQSSQHLINIFSRCYVAKATTSSFQFFQHRMLQIFKDQEKSFFPSKHFNHIDKILMTQFLNEMINSI